MKFMEIYFWNALWWAGYLPISLALYAITGHGSIAGILLIGAIFTAVISLILVFPRGILLDDWEPEPAVVVYEEYQEPEEKPQEEPKEEKPEETIIIPETPKEKMARIRQEFNVTEEEDGGEQDENETAE